MDKVFQDKFLSLRDRKNKIDKETRDLVGKYFLHHIDGFEFISTPIAGELEVLDTDDNDFYIDVLEYFPDISDSALEKSKYGCVECKVENNVYLLFETSKTFLLFGNNPKGEDPEDGYVSNMKLDANLAKKFIKKYDLKLLDPETESLKENAKKKENYKKYIS